MPRFYLSSRLYKFHDSGYDRRVSNFAVVGHTTIQQLMGKRRVVVWDSAGTDDMIPRDAAFAVYHECLFMVGGKGGSGQFRGRLVHDNEHINEAIYIFRKRRNDHAYVPRRYGVHVADPRCGATL